MSVHVVLQSLDSSDLMWPFVGGRLGQIGLTEQQERMFLKPEQLASFMPRASLFFLPTALRSHNSLANKHRGKRAEVKEYMGRQKKTEV